MASKVRVLVIDDDVTLGNLLCMLLEKDGFEGLCATGGAEGLRLAQQERPDAIILDVMMPGIHGYEVCRRLRKITEAVIVFVSVKGTTEDIVRGLHLGADDYVVKPYTYQELSSRLLACLRRRKAGTLPPVYKASREMMLVTDPDRRLRRRRVRSGCTSEWKDPARAWPAAGR